MKKYNTHIILLLLVIILFLMCCSITNKKGKELFTNIRVENKQNEEIEKMKEELDKMI